jgi:hypothetical protein
VDRSINGYLILENTGNTSGQDRGLKRSFSPAGDFTVYCKVVSCTYGWTYIWPGMFIGKSDPSDGASGDRLELNLYSTNGGGTNLQFLKYTAGVVPGGSAIFDRGIASNVGRVTRYDHDSPFPVWLRIKRVGSTLTAGVCWNGVKFEDQATTTTIGFTVDTIGLHIGESSVSYDLQGVFKYIATTG